MSFISYAQNFEDVMLWRALKHIEAGFYIDVGANDPEIDSVTRAFYERGWRGINIEPISQWYERLQASRLRDVNLQLAVGSQQGELTLFEIPDTGLSTAKKSFAEQHKVERGYQIQACKVPLDTLTNLCEQYHTSPIHFLKIDVEGMEKAVLEGTDFTKIRPWIVLVESTLPNSQKESYSEWESILLDGRYQYAYFDGLNRFYVADEHSELLREFRNPPNVFDDFVLKRNLDTETRANNADNKAQVAEARMTEYESEIQAIKTRVASAETRADAAENYAREANARIEAAQANAEATEVRAAEYEAEIQGMKVSVAQAEARADEAEQEARQANALAGETQAKAEAADSQRAAEFEAQIQVARACVVHAETRADNAEKEAREARNLIEEALAKAEVADAQAANHEAKILAVKERLAQAEARTEKAEKNAVEVNTRLQKAQFLADKARAQLSEVDTRAKNAETRADRAESELAEAKDRVQEDQLLIERLQCDMECANSQAAQIQEQLRAQDRELAAKQAELDQLNAHGQWLQNEWDASKAKVDELNHSSHHWWTVADGLNRELQTIYRSKFWCLTWPLRKLMQCTRWILNLPMMFVRRLFSWPKAAVHYLLKNLFRFAIKHPNIRLRASRWLNRRPGVKNRLRLYAQKRGILSDASRHIQVSLPKYNMIPQSISVQKVSVSDQVDLSLLTPHARKIYQGLNTALQHRKENN